MNHMEDKPPCWLINEDFLDFDAPIFKKVGGEENI